MDYAVAAATFVARRNNTPTDQAPGPSDHQDEHAAGYREVLFEMQELVSHREILVKQNRCRQTEQTQTRRAEARLPTNRPMPSAAGLKFEAWVRPSCTKSQARSNRLASKTASSSFATCFSNARVIALLPICSIERGREAD